LRAGLGKSLLPCFVGEREPGLGRLSRVVLAREIWLMVHRDLRAQARIAAVIDWLMELTPACRARS
jgi:DNA-binding transcriptional LysR family regulator